MVPLTILPGVPEIKAYQTCKVDPSHCVIMTVKDGRNYRGYIRKADWDNGTFDILIDSDLLDTHSYFFWRYIGDITRICTLKYVKSQVGQSTEAHLPVSLAAIIAEYHDGDILQVEEPPSAAPIVPSRSGCWRRVVANTPGVTLVAVAILGLSIAFLDARSN